MRERLSDYGFGEMECARWGVVSAISSWNQRGREDDCTLAKRASRKRGI